MCPLSLSFQSTLVCATSTTVTGSLKMANIDGNMIATTNDNTMEAKRRFSNDTASTDSTASTSSSSSSSTNHRLRFDLSPTIYAYPVDYCVNDRSTHWYAKDEIKAMVHAEKLAVQKHVHDQPSHVTSLLQLWATPCSQDSVLTKLVKPIQDSPLRGLEKHFLKSMKQRRSVVLNKVLKAQSKLTADTKNYDPNERAHLLKLECQPLTKTSARFARAMALGDANTIQCQ